VPNKLLYYYIFKTYLVSKNDTTFSACALEKPKLKLKPKIGCRCHGLLNLCYDIF